MAIAIGQQGKAADVLELGTYSPLYSQGTKIHPCIVSDFTVGVEGTGTATQANYMLLGTGATAAGRGYGYRTLYLLSDVATDTLSWDLELRLRAVISRISSSANIFARMQIKNGHTEADLGAVGIGILIKNYEIFAESYGTGRAETTTGITMVTTVPYTIDIIHKPAVGVYFYVNGVLKVSHTVAANIPLGDISNPRLSFSIDNQADNATVYLSIMDMPIIWQASN